MTMTQVEKNHIERKKRHPCPECQKSNFKKGVYLAVCQHCKAHISLTYLSAPWGRSWEDIQAGVDRLDKAGRYTSPVALRA